MAVAVDGWDEDRVCAWLVEVGWAMYEDEFRTKHVTGKLLIDMDRARAEDAGVYPGHVNQFLGDVKTLQDRKT